MMSGDHVPKKRGSILMYNHDQDQQYYSTGDLNDERSTGFSSFPSDDDHLLPSHDNINSSTTTATPTPLMFNHGVSHFLPNYTTSTDTNFVYTTSILSDYGLGAAAHRYNLRPDLVTKDGITMSSIMDVNTSTTLSPASAGGGGVMISTTPYNTTPVTGNSSVSSPSTDLEEDAAGGQEDSSISSRILCDNNNTATTINKGDYNIDHHRMNHMDDQEEGKQPMLIKENDDTTAAGGGDKSKKLLSKSGKKGEKRQKEPRFAFMTKSEVDHLEDGYRWRKYGQKAVKNSPYPRSYYRCTTQKCGVKKRVERSYQDPSIVVTTYEGQHTHPSPATVRGSSHILAPPPPSALTMPLSSFHRDNYHALKLHQLMNAASAHEFSPGSIANDNNTNYLRSLVPTSDPSLQRQQLRQVLLSAAAADQYGLLQDNVAVPSSFNINSNGRLP